MPASLEPIVYCLRAGPEHQKYGDPFTVSCVVSQINDFAYLFGFVSSDIWRERNYIVEALRRVGVRTIVSQRIKNGVARPMVMRI